MKAKSVSMVGALLALIPLTACNPQKDSPQSTSEAAPVTSRGVGPITSVALGALDSQKAARGEKLFQEKCSACHKFEEKYVGPALAGVTTRRSPAWIMNMILNPEEMTKSDPIAKELLATHFTQMTFQNVSQDDARAILEFFRQHDAPSGGKE
ncbi:MAG: cytochrome c [Deltaproteobacteria bacterium]|nr:cytochrome c [Deltaproteobacteria bacterium]